MATPMATPIGVVSEKKSAIATIDLRQNLPVMKEKNFVTTLVKHCFIIGITQVFFSSMGSIQIQNSIKRQKPQVTFLHGLTRYLA
jgi:hypothetical protein